MSSRLRLSSDINALTKKDRILSLAIFGIRAVLVRSGKLKEVVSAASRKKDNTSGSIGHVEDMFHRPSLDTTTELIAVWNPEKPSLQHSHQSL